MPGSGEVLLSLIAEFGSRKCLGKARLLMGADKFTNVSCISARSAQARGELVLAASDQLCVVCEFSDSLMRAYASFQKLISVNSLE